MQGRGLKFRILSFVTFFSNHKLAVTLVWIFKDI